MSSKHFFENGCDSYTLDCGCVVENINGRFITIMCDVCEENHQNYNQKIPKKFKMRIDNEN